VSAETARTAVIAVAGKRMRRKYTGSPINPVPQPGGNSSSGKTQVGPARADPQRVQDGRDGGNQVRKRDDEGFTLIELLVVVVIIGVLVAIAVPIYLNYRKGAADKSAQSDVRGAVGAVEQFYAANGNTLPDTVKGADAPIPLTAASLSNPSNQTITLSDKTQLGYVKAGESFLVCANSGAGSGNWYLYNSANGGSVQAASGTLSLDTCG
jgi:type IV pilus assembly protein PilA